MPKRNYMQVGGMTNVGGVVISGLSTSNWHGKANAFEGDRIQCQKCKSIGVIKIAGTRISCKGRHGKEAALSDDLCICRCYPPPVLVASQSLFGTQGVAIPSSLKTTNHDEQFLLKDDEGNSLPEIPYTVRLPSGELEHGETDGEGRTRRYFTDGAQNLEFHIGHIHDH